MSGLSSYKGKSISAQKVSLPTLNNSSSTSVLYEAKELSNSASNELSLDLSDFLEQSTSVSEEIFIDESMDIKQVEIPVKKIEESKPWYEKVFDAVASAGATVVVGTTSLISGVAEVGEHIVDGGAYVVSGTASLLGAEEFSTDVKEFIATDWVDEANVAFYENTNIGQSINDKSAMEYDSEAAQTIKNITESATVMAASTAATVCTGGTASILLPTVTGFAYGTGNAAEDTYAANGTDTSGMQDLLILANGGFSALSWYTTGNLGKGFVEVGKGMAEASVQEVLAEMAKGIFSKDMLNQLLSPKNVVGNAIATLMQESGDIANIATKLYNGQEVTSEEWSLLVGELVVYFGLNVGEDVLSDAIINYGTQKIDIDTTKIPDADTTSPPPVDTLDEIGLDDVKTKQPDVDTPSQTPEVLDEPDILPETKTPHPDDEYVDKALDILDPNTATKLSDEINNLDEVGLQKVLSAMTGAEIAGQLDTLDATDVDRVLNALDGQQTTDLVGTLAERISKGEMPSEILDKLDPSIKLEALERTDPNFVQNGDGWQMHWENNEGVTPEISLKAENNYQGHSSDFTGRKDYYASLAETEGKNYWVRDENGKWQHIVLDSNDPGITAPLTDAARNSWQNAVRDASNPYTGTTRVNVGNANPEAFDSFVVGDGAGQYGNFGMPDNYNFGRLGEADPAKFIAEAKANGTDVLYQFKEDSGIPQGASKYDRLIFSSHDVDTNSVSMHTGKELNSYSERLPGGRLPSGEYEVVYETQRITQGMATSTPVQILDSSGEIIYDGTLSELNSLKHSDNQADRDLYRYYVFGN